MHGHAPGTFGFCMLTSILVASAFFAFVAAGCQWPSGLEIAAGDVRHHHDTPSRLAAGDCSRGLAIHQQPEFAQAVFVVLHVLRLSVIIAGGCRFACFRGSLNVPAITRR
jgi:hypothetical protein